MNQKRGEKGKFREQDKGGTHFVISTHNLGTNGIPVLPCKERLLRSYFIKNRR